eukprot:3432840-Pyramimonas_sp.AAC.2
MAIETVVRTFMEWDEGPPAIEQMHGVTRRAGIQPAAIFRAAIFRAAIFRAAPSDQPSSECSHPPQSSHPASSQPQSSLGVRMSGEVAPNDRFDMGHDCCEDLVRKARKVGVRGGPADFPRGRCGEQQWR